MPLRRRIDQADRSRRSLARDLQPCHLVAQFERQIEDDGRRTLAGRELERGFSEPLAARGIRIHAARPRRAARRQNGRFELSLLAEMRCKAERLASLRLVENGDRSIAREFGKRLYDSRDVRLVIDAVLQPDDAWIFDARFSKRLPQSLGGRAAIRREGFRHKRCGRAPRFGRRLNLEHRQSRRRRRSCDDHRTALAFRFADDPVNHLNAFRPPRRR